jgi:outer membrane biogenesis lipoprotein LolB
MLQRQNPVVTMKIFLTSVLVTLLLAGCATISDNKRQKSFDETTLLYEKIIRWGDFAAASQFQQLEGDAQGRPLPQADIRVTSYRQLSRNTLSNENTIAVKVQIDYYHNDTLKVITLTDNQIWKYTPDENSWRITTPLPVFH